MKRIILLAAAAFAAMPLVQAAAQPTTPAKKDQKPARVRLSDADNKKTIKLAAGTSFDIALKGNASTGFQWQLAKIKGDAIRQTAKGDYVLDKHPERMVGFGGTFVFHFNVAKAEKTKIRLAYVRPWEKDKEPEKTFEVLIDSLSPAAADEENTLVFEGTVASIVNAPVVNSSRGFVVTMQVNRVVKGQYDGKTFQFRVHSPTRSGLKVRGRYTVEAKRTAGGYAVDQNQWMQPSEPAAAPDR
jgi:inhibitor of cysteine peptidase